MISRRTLLAGLSLPLAGGWLCGCQTTATSQVNSGYVPAANTDEGGLWRLMDKAESQMKYSKFLVRDAELTRYLTAVTCRIAGDVCPDTRVYLTRAPYFNASMAPNGMMQIWSGLLLRVTSESQLAAIIGHELGHYVKRHSLQRWRNAKNSLAVSNILGMGLGIAGAGVLAQLPGIIALASILAYTRDQEREADTIGLDLMVRAGYRPLAASEVWDNLINERDADPNQRERDLFASTHPEPEERRDELRAKAAEFAPNSAQRQEDELLIQARRIRADMLDDEVRLRQPERSLVVIGRLRAAEPDDPELAMFEAEILRLRAAGGDLERAESLLAEAAQAGAPPRAWRSLGLVRRHRGADDLANHAFQRYLELAPSAPDAALIRSYIRP